MENDTLRRQISVLLITVAAAIMAGRIVSTVRNYEPYLHKDEANEEFGDREMRQAWPKTRPRPMPTFSSNDRSRWATIRALVDNGTYVVGYREVDPATGKYQDHGIVFEDGWGTIDRVLHPDPVPGQPNTYRFYSSKPPLFPTLLAGEYWLLQRLFGLSLADEGRWAVIRTTVLTVNLLPLVVYFLLLSRLLDRLGSTDWARLFVLAAACFGTLVTLYAITINNHTVATCTGFFALYATLQIWSGQTAKPLAFASAGLFGAFTAAIELPALALTAALFALLLWKDWKRTLLFFVPAAAIPTAAFFATNYLAIERWTPAYGEFGGPWYEYEGSAWKANPGKEKRGIDWAGQKETRLTYAFHLLLGHHGIFSLTPIFVLSVVGIWWSWRAWRSRAPTAEEPPPQPQATPQVLIAALTLVLSVVVVGFYLYKTTNYGGWSNGARWLFWLTPLWLLTMLPVVEHLAQRRWGRGLCLGLLALSVLSANYRDWNAWRHPWVYQVLDTLGGIPY